MLLSSRFLITCLFFNFIYVDMDAPFSSVSSRIKQRAVIEFLTQENEAPVEIHRRLLAVYDEDTVDISTVRRWVRKSKASGGNLDVSDQPRSGRPTTSTNEQNKQKVNELIRENRRITQRTIAVTLGISLASVNEIVVDLEYTKVCARWVPRQLTPEMKTVRLQTCQMLLTRYEREGDNFLHSIVTGDESWVHHYDPEMKCQSMEYRHSTSPRVKKFKTQQSAGKCLLTVFWDYRGVIHQEFMAKGTTINSEAYVQTIRKLKQRINRVRRDKKPMILQHDNARPHTSVFTKAALDNFGFQVLAHPPYSPDLAPSDFWLFGTLKKYLRGIHFTCDDEIQAATIKWFREQPEKFYSDGIQKLVERWRRCVERLGDYVEK
jgi:histone-lysine N-methyltransferase SETMAR